MFRIDDPTAATALPVPEAAGTEGYFTEGNPVAGTAATLVRGSFLNMIQEELRAIVVAGGLVPSKTTYNQVLAAIRALGKQSVQLADTGAVNAYAAVNPTPLVAGTWVNGVVQQVTIAHTNTGASTYAPDGLTAIPIYGLGLSALQGGELLLNGTAILMKATISGVNSGNPICVLMECFGGAQQVATATQSQHAVPLGQVPVFGGVRNLKASLATAGTSLTFTADAIVVKSALNGISTLLTSYNQALSLAAGTGAGKMDTGTAPVSGYVAAYATWGPAVGAGIVGQNATSAAASEQYSGANLPAGVTETQLIGVWPTNGSSQFIVGYQAERELYFIATQLISTSSGSGTPTSTSIAGVVPMNARTVSGNLTGVNNTSPNGSSVSLAATSTLIGQKQASATAALSNAGILTPFSDMPLITPQTMFFTNVAVGGGTSSITANATSYTF